MNKDIEEVIVKQLLGGGFSPPKRIQGNQRAIESTLAIYRRVLAPYSRDILEQAWAAAVARNETWAWPTPGEIVREAERLQQERQPEPEAPVPQADWLPEAERLWGEYVRRFMDNSKEATRARAGGYEPLLRRYVEESAWVQAQMIAGREGVGYDGILFAHAEDLDHEREAFFTAAKAQAEKGFIQVRVPKDLVRRWAEDAKGQGVGR